VSAKYCYWNPSHSEPVGEGQRRLSLNDDCGEDEICFSPVLQHSELIIEVEMGGGKRSLSAGHPFSVYQSVIVSDFKLHHIWDLIGIGRLLPLNFPAVLQKMMWYLCSLSGGLIINILPTFFLDGAYACRASVDLVLQSLGLHGAVAGQRRDKIIFIIFVLTMCLLVANIAVGLATVNK